MLDSRCGRRLAAILGLSVFSISCNRDPGPQVGQPVPDFTLPDLEGKEHPLSDYRGKVVVLNFWATWCPPCIDEMPSLQRLHDALAAQGLAVVAISADERFSDIGAFVRKFELTFVILHDAGKKVSRKYQSFKYPETYIVDRDGRLKSKVVGPRDWSSPSVIRDMVELLREEPPPRESAVKTSNGG
ncbi:MAG: peroxiredoxin family protein [Vicinamibacteria bacterium]